VLVLLYAPPHGLSRALAHCPRPTSHIINNNNPGTQIAELQSPRIHPTGTGRLPQMRVQVGQHVTPELPQRCCIFRDHCGISKSTKDMGLAGTLTHRTGSAGGQDNTTGKASHVYARSNFARQQNGVVVKFTSFVRVGHAMLNPWAFLAP